MPEEYVPLHDVSVVIPTYREPGIVDLLRGIDEVCAGAGIVAEIIVVDDTPDDGTVRAARGAFTGCTVFTIHRPVEGHVWGGLAGAVVDGMREAGAPIVVVMDGDGQHPPDVIPVMVSILQRTVEGQIDLVAASRYTVGGDLGGLDGRWRRNVSTASTTLARWMFPKRVGRKTTDPMTGFFAVRVGGLDLMRVAHHADGFKILLAVLATHPQLQVSEVPFRFGERDAGESKATLRNGTVFLKQLLRLRVDA